MFSYPAVDIMSLVGVSTIISQLVLSQIIHLVSHIRHQKEIKKGYIPMKNTH